MYSDVVDFARTSSFSWRAKLTISLKALIFENVRQDGGVNHDFEREKSPMNAEHIFTFPCDAALWILTSLVGYDPLPPRSLISRHQAEKSTGW